jgi:hypothetical protein
VRAGELDVVPRRRGESVDRIAVARRLVDDLRLQQIGPVEPDLAEDRRLAFEVLVERGGADAESRRDAAHRQPLLAEFAPDLEARLNDPLP